MADNSDDLLISVSTDLTTIKRQLRQLGQDITVATNGVQKQFEKVGAGIDKSMSTALQTRINEMVGIGTKGAKEWQGVLADQGKEFERLRTKINPVFATITRYKASIEEIRSAQRLGAISSDEMTAAISRERTAALASIAAIKQRKAALSDTPVRQGFGTFNTANIAAQFQDIGVTTAMGMSPIQIALQQGTQLSAVLNTMGGTKGAIAGLGAAFMQIVNPVSLVTIGVIAAGAAAAQFFATFMSGSEDTAAELKAQAELIQKVANKWGDALPSIKAYADEQQRLADGVDVKDATKAIISRFFDGARKDVDKLSDSLTDLGYQMDSSLGKREQFAEIQKAFAAVKKRIDEGGDSTKEVTALQKLLNDTYAKMPIPAIQKFADVVDGLAKAWKKAADNADAARVAANKYNDPQIYDPRDPRYKGIPLPATAPVPHMLGVDDVGSNPAMRGFSQSADSLSAAIKKFTDDVVHAESRGIADAKNPKSTATGTGQFIESTWLSLFRKYYPDQAANMSRDAILELRKNADYSYGLIQAYAKENAAVLQKAGVTVTESALQLSHFLGAGDAAKVLKAAPGTPLAGLISAKSIAANPAILGGGKTVDDAIAYSQRRVGGATFGGNKKTPDELFKGDQDAIQRRIDLINAQFEAQQKLNPLIKDYGFQVEQARIYQELLNDAQKRGVEVTPEMKKGLEELAANYATATAARNQLTEAQTLAAQSAQQGSEFGKDLLGGFISDLRSGKTAAEALAGALSKVADKLLDMALNSAFGLGPGGNGTGGPLSFIGTLLGGLFRANGGPVEAGQPYIVGEKRPELFVPNVPGRIVPRVPTANSGSGAGGGGGTTVVTINAPINAPGADAAALARVERSVQELGKNIPKMVDARNDARQTRKTRA